MARNQKGKTKRAFRLENATRTDKRKKTAIEDVGRA